MFMRISRGPFSTAPRGCWGHPKLATWFPSPPPWPGGGGGACPGEKASATFLEGTRAGPPLPWLGGQLGSCVRSGLCRRGRRRSVNPWKSDGCKEMGRKGMPRGMLAEGQRLGAFTRGRKSALRSSLRHKSTFQTGPRANLGGWILESSRPMFSCLHCPLVGFTLSQALPKRGS